ncbi:hypothetical protein HY485_00325 [Candidatus Woesearchaeota archaeon]|nr:hypothetical protein [Candidatus Woesearchaeota archaeon]
MKKILWIVLALLLTTIVTAQTTNPFKQIEGPLGNVFDAAAKLLSLEFVEKDYQIEALFRLFLFLIIFSVLHSVLKNTIGKQQNKILEEKAVNVLSAVIALGVAIFLPIEFLFRGAVILIGFMTTGVAIAIYWAIRIERNEQNKVKGALIGAGLLFALFIVMSVLFSLSGDLGGFKIGAVQLVQLPDFANTQKTFITFILWSQTVIVIAFIIELVIALIHYEGHTKIAGYVPEAVSSAPRRTWHWFGEKVARPGGSGVIEWLKKRIRTTGLAIGMLEKLKLNISIWGEAIKKGEYTVLKDKSTQYKDTINSLLAWDYDTLKRVPTEPDEEIKKIVKRLKAVDSLLIALYKHPLPTWLEDMYRSPKELSEEDTEDAVKKVNEAIMLIDALIKAQKQELGEEVSTEEEEEAHTRT